MNPMPIQNARRSSRVAVEMSLRSTSLPRYQASILDLSDSGARLELKGAVSQALENQRIRFGASLPGQNGVHFEGLARVAWIKHTARGWEAGLEWERMTPHSQNMVHLAVNAA